MAKNGLKSSLKHPEMAAKPSGIPGISEGKKKRENGWEKNPTKTKNGQNQPKFTLKMAKKS